LFTHKAVSIKREKKSDSPELIPLLLGDENYCKAVLPKVVLQTDGSTLWRDVALAIENIYDPAAVPALVQALSYSEPKVCLYVAWALGRIGDKKTKRALARSLNSEVGLKAQKEIETALQGR